MENKLNPSSINPKLVTYYLSLRKKIGLYPLLSTPGLLAFCINLNLGFRHFTFNPIRYLKNSAHSLNQLMGARKRKLTSIKKYISHRQKLVTRVKVTKPLSFLSVVSWRRWLLLGRRLRPFDRIMLKWRINWERFAICRNKAFLKALQDRITSVTKGSFKKSTPPSYTNQSIPWGSFSKKPNFYLLRRKKFNANPKYGCWRILRKLFIRRRQRKLCLRKKSSNRAIYLKIIYHNSYKLLASRLGIRWSECSMLPTPSKHHLKHLSAPSKSAPLDIVRPLAQSRWVVFSERFKVTRFPYKTWITRKVRLRKSSLRKELMGRGASRRYLKLTKFSRRLKALNFTKGKSPNLYLISDRILPESSIPNYLQLHKWRPYRSFRWAKYRHLTGAYKLTQKCPVLSIQKNLTLTRPLTHSAFFLNFLRFGSLPTLPFFQTFHSNLPLWKKLVLKKSRLFLPATQLKYRQLNLKLKLTGKIKSKLKPTGKVKSKLKPTGKVKLDVRLKAPKLSLLQRKARLARPNSFLRPLTPKTNIDIFSNSYKVDLKNKLINTTQCEYTGKEFTRSVKELAPNFSLRQFKRRTWKISTARRLIPSLLKKNYRRIGKRYKQRPYNSTPYKQIRRSRYLFLNKYLTSNYVLTSYNSLTYRTLFSGISRQLLSHKVRPFWRPNRKRPLWRSRRRRYVKYFRTSYVKFNINVRRRSSLGRLPRLHRIKKKIKKLRRKLFLRRTFAYGIRGKAPTTLIRSFRGAVKFFFYQTHLPSFLSTNYPNSLRFKSLISLLTLGGLLQPLLTYTPNPRYFLESDYLVDFAMPPHGYLYLTPLSQTPILLKWLSVKVKTYSFTSFYDIKEFFLKKYSGGSRTLKSPLLLKRRRVHNKFWSLYQTSSFTEAHLSANAKLMQTPGIRTGLSGHLSPQVDPKIRRIRFKPGYSKIWRTARKALKFSLNLTYFYQHQLTKFLIKFFKFSKIKLMQYHELRIVNILLYSRLAPDLSSAKDLISYNLVFVNGALCLNPNLILLKNDLFQLVISLKYYILTKWLVLWVKKKKKRLSKFALKNHLKLNSHRSGVLSERFPKWILTTLFFKADIPTYLEIDYFTLAGFILYQPFRYLDFNPFSWQFNQYSIYNIYNWKYIT